MHVTPLPNNAGGAVQLTSGDCGTAGSSACKQISKRHGGKGQLA
jgi:hypothetical protein